MAKKHEDRAENLRLGFCVSISRAAFNGSECATGIHGVHTCNVQLLPPSTTAYRIPGPHRLSNAGGMWIEEHGKDLVARISSVHPFWMNFALLAGAVHRTSHMCCDSNTPIFGRRILSPCLDGGALLCSHGSALRQGDARRGEFLQC